jgi:hypothetical protein
LVVVEIKFRPAYSVTHPSAGATQNNARFFLFEGKTGHLLKEE